MLKEPVSTAFDSYQIVRTIGEGGSGTVYEAQNSAGEVVALKCMKPKLPTSKRKRFKNEILFCQRSEHPNIVRVIDTGAVLVKKEVLSFYVMPYFPATMRSIIVKRINSEQILPLFSQLLNGVEAAHLKGIHHRDLKPENVLFDDKSNTLVVADFGAADFTEDELYTVVETQHGERIGNFQYAAPEQRTRGGMVDHRADIYALGLILNEMFTGEVPSGTGHRLIASAAAQHAYLDDLVETMRRQSPDARFQSIREVKAQIAARGNAFIEFQRLDTLKRTVVSETVADDPSVANPVQVVGVAYQADEALVFTLEPQPSPAWVSVLTNPRGAHSSVLGHPPQSVRFVKNTAVLSMPAYAVESAVSHFKEWVNMANRTLPEMLRDEALRRDREERERLSKAIQDEEKRQQAQQKAQKALGLTSS